MPSVSVKNHHRLDIPNIIPLTMMSFITIDLDLSLFKSFFVNIIEIIKLKTIIAKNSINFKTVSPPN